MESPPLVQHVAVADEELPVATPLLRPADGVPAVIDTEEAFDAALTQLAQGTGPFAFDALNELIQGVEVILHASTQDLPCLREVGIYPNILFDTELGGRIAGLPRVGLGPLLETLMGVSLAKEHSAVDWST